MSGSRLNQSERKGGSVLDTTEPPFPSLVTKGNVRLARQGGLLAGHKRQCFDVRGSSTCARLLSAKGCFVLFRLLRSVGVCCKSLTAIVEDRAAPLDAALKLAVQLSQASDLILVFVVRHHKTQSTWAAAQTLEYVALFLRAVGILLAVAFRQRITPPFKRFVCMLPEKQCAVENYASRIETVLHRTLREFLFGHGAPIRS